jgi:hypothetical protein
MRATLYRRAATLVLATAALFGMYAMGAAQAADTAATTTFIDWQQVRANKYIRAWGGIPPCTWEDGMGQPGMCYWDGGDPNTGTSYIAVPTMPGHDKRIVVLDRHLATRD